MVTSRDLGPFSRAVSGDDCPCLQEQCAHRYASIGLPFCSIELSELLESSEDFLDDAFHVFATGLDPQDQAAFLDVES